MMVRGGEKKRKEKVIVVHYTGRERRKIEKCWRPKISSLFSALHPQVSLFPILWNGGELLLSRITFYRRHHNIIGAESGNSTYPAASFICQSFPSCFRECVRIVTSFTYCCWSSCLFVCLLLPVVLHSLLFVCPCTTGRPPVRGWCWSTDSRTLPV